MQKVIGDEMSPPPYELYFQTAPIEGIDDLHVMLDELRAEPLRAVLRGEPLEHSDEPQRRLLDRTIVDVPRAWLMLDLDSIPEPDGVSFTSEPSRCADHARSLLPEPFHSARCVWRASGSAGFKPGVRLHLWFLLDRPLTGPECKAWLSHAGVPIDHSVFGAVHLHYTADPDLGDADDPMSARIGKLPGDTEHVHVPDELPKEARAATTRSHSAPSDMAPRPEDAADLPEDDQRGTLLQDRVESLYAELGTATDGRKQLANNLGFAVGELAAREAWNASADPAAALAETCDEWSQAVVGLLEHGAYELTHGVAAYDEQLRGGVSDGFAREWHELHRHARGQAALERILQRSKERRERSAPANDTRSDAAEMPSGRRFEFRSPSQIFTVKPPKIRLCPALQLGAGRTNIFVGRAGSCKTWAVQDLVLAVATGGKVWDRHDVTPGVAVHLDYEMAEELEHRYLQLARGRGIDDPKTALEGRLRVAPLPSIYLTQDDAFDALVDAATGAKLLVIDSLMAACAGIDENDSRSRMYLDQLTRVSEATGACVVVLHHAGKGGEQRDRRNLARGSSAFLDAAGCVLNFEKLGETDKIEITQAKAAGGPMIPDQQISLQPRGAGGLVVRGSAATNKSAAASQRDDVDRALILDIVSKHPACSQNALEDKTGLKRPRLPRLLEELEREDRIVCLPGKRGARTFRLTATEESRRTCR